MMMMTNDDVDELYPGPINDTGCSCDQRFCDPKPNIALGMFLIGAFALILRSGKKRRL